MENLKLIHKVRNSLTILQGANNAAKNYLKPLVESYRKAKAEGLEVSQIDEEDFELLNHVMAGAKEASQTLSACLDELEDNLRKNHVA